jgi:hypothetical protein
VNFFVEFHGELFRRQALMWWSPDDSSTSVRIPVYGGTPTIPTSFADPVGQEPGGAVATGVDADAGRMSLDSAFWVWNLVSNMAYGARYDAVYPVILSEIRTEQNRLFQETAAMDKRITALYAQGKPQEATAAIGEFVATTGDAMTATWRNFWMKLFARFRDGFTVGPPQTPQCDATKGQKTGCTSRSIPDTQATGYSDRWYARVAADGDNRAHYAVPTGRSITAEEERKIRAIDKRL